MEIQWENWCRLCGNSAETIEIKENPDILFFLSYYFQVIQIFGENSRRFQVFQIFLITDNFQNWCVRIMQQHNKVHQRIHIKIPESSRNVPGTGNLC